jgi:hypothetical protein
VPHLKGFSPLSLLKAQEILDDSRESELSVACNAMQQVVQQAFYSCCFEVVS